MAHPRMNRLFAGLSATALLVTGNAFGQDLAPAPNGVVPPPLSTAKAEYFKAHPDAWTRLIANLPRQSNEGDSATAKPFGSSKGGVWQLVSPAPSGGLCNPLLLTDATVIIHRCDSPVWYRLSPDMQGNYAQGTWSQIAMLPVIDGKQYQPQYHASAVLPDGRVIIMGGEYDGGGQGVWTNQGAIYDPLADQWTPVAAPIGKKWKNIGDASGVVLANGTFMLGGCCGNPAVDALFNPANLSWTPTGAPQAGDHYQDEQGYELLPDGNVLTIDIWTNFASQGNATNAEQYSTLTGKWASAGNTPVSLPDPYQCGNFEIGPAVVRGDGKVVAFGGNTGCVAGATADPTAILDVKSGAWSLGPYLPAVCGPDGATSCDLADAPAALLPNGSILFAASAGYGTAPTHFFEFSRKDTVEQVSDTRRRASSSGAYYYNFLVLPNGQVLATDFSDRAEVYSPAGSTVAEWAPAITSVPSSLSAGVAYTVIGKQLNGRSQGAYYGDDAQAATNYPIVKLVNSATGHVFYARSSNFSGMSIAPDARDESAQFVLPVNVEAGPASLSVVANGIPSKPVRVVVQ